MTTSTILFITLVNVLSFSISYPQQSSQSTNLKACLINAGTHPSLYITKDNNSSMNYDVLNFQQNKMYGVIQPLAILLVESTSDVANAIRCAKEHNIRIVAKSGGHSFEKYSYGDANSVVIDLRKLDNISVDKISRTVEVGAGVLWAHLHWKLWNAGKLAFPAGVCITLGAGTTLGGGHGILSKRFGLAVDNVLEMDIVDSSGNIRIVNQEENPDLFWALRGAGKGNFGIVTKLKYKVHEVSEKYTHMTLVFNDSEFPQVLRAWDKWNAENQGGTVYSLFTAGPGFLTIDVIDSGLNDSSIANIANYFEGQSQRPIINTNDYIDMIARNRENGYNYLGKILERGSEMEHVERDGARNVRYWIRIKSYFASKPISAPGIDMIVNKMRSIPKEVNLKFSSTGGAMNTVSPDTTAFVHRNALYYLQMGITSDSESVNRWVEEFDEILLRVVDNGESFQNSMDGQLKNYLVRYYGSNLPRLVKIKKTVDPENVFNYAQSIPLDL